MSGARCVLWLLARVTPRRDRDALLGDLLEEHAERGGLAREALRAIGPMLVLRFTRAGGPRALVLVGLAGLGGARLIVLLVEAIWRQVLSGVPLRAAGAMPLAWQLLALVPALLAGVLAARVAHGLAVRLLGGAR